MSGIDRRGQGDQAAEARRRHACWREDAVTIRYGDKADRITERTIWPVAIVYVDRKLVVLAWCCLREAHRMFRADRIALVSPAGTSFRPKLATLLRDYLAELRGSREGEGGSISGRSEAAPERYREETLGTV